MSYSLHWMPLLYLLWFSCSELPPHSFHITIFFTDKLLCPQLSLNKRNQSFTEEILTYSSILCWNTALLNCLQG
uniref:Putative secreted protein n=1 Tax=Ixodes ricinus TaxID=34613 RepID=A0A147BP36_IXORI